MPRGRRWRTSDKGNWVPFPYLHRREPHRIRLFPNRSSVGFVESILSGGPNAQTAGLCKPHICIPSGSISNSSPGKKTSVRQSAAFCHLRRRPGRQILVRPSIRFLHVLKAKVPAVRPRRQKTWEMMASQGAAKSVRTGSLLCLKESFSLFHLKSPLPLIKVVEAAKRVDCKQAHLPETRSDSAWRRSNPFETSSRITIAIAHCPSSEILWSVSKRLFVALNFSSCFRSPGV